jgi:hypothetical protein
MKIRSSITLCLLSLSAACLVTLFMPTASAVTAKELLRVEQNQAFQGLCCFSWLESVHATEPATVVPVIVTWSTDYQATGPFLAGLSVNGRPCKFFGSASIQPFGRGDGSGPFESRLFQWFILPGEGLHRGNNSFTLCGGGTLSPSAVILLGFNTMTVRTMK